MDISRVGKQRITARERASVLIKAAFDALRDAGGSLTLTEVKRAVVDRVQLIPFDLEVFERTGNVRWEALLHFYSIDCVKAGFLKKQSGQWTLTPEGETASHLTASELLSRAQKGYREWKAAQGVADSLSAVPQSQDRIEQLIEEKAEPSFILETAEAQARTEIEERVKAKGPYEFQDLVAALLRGMSYHTPFLASPGPDGGTDILAYPDPIGARTPHIRVQVKHRPSQKVTREEVAALRGIIRQDREIGLFVSSGGFTSEAMREARSGAVHIELMDLARLLNGWADNYEKLKEEDRALLRLQRIYFLSPE
jgi:restriction system protein